MRTCRMYLLTVCATLIYTCVSFAQTNPITVTYLNSSTTDFLSGSNGNVYYLVAVSSGVIPPGIPLTLYLANANSSSPNLVVQQTTSGPTPTECSGVSLCGAMFPLSAGQNCCLALTLSSNTAGNYTLQPLVQSSPPAFSAQASSALAVTTLTGLSVTPATLTLSVTGLTTTTGNNSGTPRVFTLRNTGSSTARDVTCPTSTSPSIASITCQGCEAIVSGGTCTITVTPSATPSAAPGDTNPTPVTLTIQGSNTNTLHSTVNILTYGSYYTAQAGYLFSIIETADTSASIGGTVAAETDAASQSTYAPTGQTVASSDMSSGTMGATNTQAMRAAYGTAQNYSAGYCISTNYNAGGYIDWYLPAICEMGYGAQDNNFNCTTTNYIPNIQANLIEKNPSQTFNFVSSNFYWSSTASLMNSLHSAWFEQYDVGGPNSVQGYYPLNGSFSVRCVRAIT